MSLPFQNVAVMCGPHKGASLNYEHAAEELGHCMGRRTVALAAAGQKDLLSKFSRAAYSEGPEMIAYFDQDHDDGRTLCPPYPKKLVADEAQRNALLLDKADMLVALPGDLDTCCSFGQSGRPVIIVNLNGQFKHAKSIMAQAVADGKIGHNSVGNVHWSRCVDEAMDIFDDLRIRALAL
jgi:predicted Rossmann-fold nucleotide-binding protein